MDYLAPGVYIRYVLDGPLLIRAASTSTAVFVGPTTIGRDGAGGTITPTKVTSLTEYADKYATTGAKAGVVNLPTTGNAISDPMGHAVRGFFLNGGQNAYIVSLSTAVEAVASGILQVTATSNQEYLITANSAGAWGNAVTVTVSTSARGQDFCDVEVSCGYLADDSATSTHTERFVGVSANALQTIQSGLVTFEAVPDSANEDFTIDVSADPPPAASVNHTLSGGVDAGSGLSGDMGPVFEALADIDDISLIAMPGRVWPAAQADYEAAIAHCQAMKDRMVLIQLDNATTDFGAVSVPLDKYASVYYPEADVSLSVPGGQTLTQRIGTTGHIAGIFARTDGEKGAWTAPAGLHASIAGITQLTQDISQTRQESINPNNVNALRYIQGIPVIWGARTRDQGGIYEYVPVMRTAFLIADSLRSALNRAVFAKNTEVLWKNVKLGVTGFMDTLYNQGAFQGATPSQAFEVAVGLGESMTQTDIDSGLLRVTVRFRPAKPAETIEISVEQLFGAA